MNNLIEIQHRTRFGQLFTLAMFRGVANDVATYEHKGHVEAWKVAANGRKWTERDNAVDGISIPDGMHYRR